MESPEKLHMTVHAALPYVHDKILLYIWRAKLDGESSLGHTLGSHKTGLQYLKFSFRIQSWQTYSR